MYVQRKTQERLRAHCYRRKAASMIYSECVAVALVLQHAKCMRCIFCHLWPVRQYRIFPHFLINGAIFEYIYILTIKCLILSQRHVCLQVKYPLFLSDFNHTWIFSAGFRKNSNIKFHGNPSSRNQVVPRGRAGITNLRCSIPKCLYNKRWWRTVKHNTRAWRWFSRIETCSPNITLYR